MLNLGLDTQSLLQVLVRELYLANGQLMMSRGEKMHLPYPTLASPQRLQRLLLVKTYGRDDTLTRYDDISTHL